MAEVSSVMNIADVTVSYVRLQDDAFPLPIMVVCFDQENNKHNIMSRSFFTALGYALDLAYRNAFHNMICAVVFCSGKSSFIVGADIEYQLNLTSEEV